jgi:predicted metal-dependent phosphotriesterase family hydrolase
MDNLNNVLAHGSRTLPNSPSSTHDAEVQMLAKGVMHSLGICSLPEDLGIKTDKLKAMCDNSAAVIVGQTGVHKEASRLAWIRYWQLRDLVELSVIDLQQVSSKENVSNLMTKVLRGQDFVQQRDRIVAVRPRIFKSPIQ